MNEIRRDLLVRYGAAALAIAVGVALRVMLDPILSASGFVISLLALLIAAWVGGLGPCLLGQTLTIAMQMLMFSSPLQVDPDPRLKMIAGLSAFFTVGISVALLSEFTRAAQQRARAQAEQAVWQREQLRATLACMADGVIVTDAAGRLTMMNPLAESLTGWTCAQSAGQPLEKVFVIRNEQSQQIAESPATRVQRENRTVYQETSLLLATKDQRCLPVDYSAAPIHDVQGATLGVVLVFRDATERRCAEQALRDADRRKDEFLATLAHELRNPLAPIRTGLEVLKLAGDDPALCTEIRATMERQTDHMVRLIDDLLDASRITRGKLQLRKCRVELAEIVRNAIDSTRPLIDAAHHEFTVTLPPQPIFLDGDPHRLAQVLANLLNNAAKYTPARGQISLSARQHNLQVAIAIQDNGLGIPDDIKGRIFEMFGQIDRSTETGYAGLGIGLTLVNSLVEMHAGTVEVTSAGSNQGSEFIVRLPILPDSPPKDLPQPCLPIAAVSFATRILVVDDNRDALAVLSTMVRILGHEVRTAHDGVEAIGAAESFQPDAVLMDLGMPRMNGYEAARHIREQPWGQSMLLVATTGWGQDEDKRRSKEAGFDHHLVKPIDPTALRALLSRLTQPAVSTC